MMNPSIDDIRSRLAKLRAKAFSVERRDGLARFILLLTSVVALLSIIEALFHSSPMVRACLVSIGVLTITLGVWKFLILPFYRMHSKHPPFTDHDLAKLVGKKFPEIRDRLVNILQIVEEQERTPQMFSSSLIDAAVRDMHSHITEYNFASVIDETPASQLLRRVVAGLGLYVVLCVLVPSFFLQAGYRLIHFTEVFAAPAPFTFHIGPGDTTVVKGTDVIITLKLIGEQRTTAELIVHTNGLLNEQTIQAQRDSNFQFQWHLPLVKNSLEYCARVNDYKSREYTINVIDRPMVKSFRIILKPPGYTGLQSQMLDENMGDITALSGTHVEMSVNVNKDSTKGWIVFSDSTKHFLEGTGKELHGSFIVKSSSSYSIGLEDQHHIAGIDPVWYKIQAVDDQPPSIAITVPGRNVDLGDQKALQLLINIHDDFGFSLLRLHYRLSQSKYEAPQKEYTVADIPLPSAPPLPAGEYELNVPYSWDLTPLNLAAEDVVSYFAEVFDNDRVHGPKAAKSQEFTIRYPSLDELFTDTDKKQVEAEQNLVESLKESESLKKSLDQISDQLKKNQKNEWQDKKKMEEIAKRYDELRKNVQENSQHLDSTVASMMKNNVLSQETLDKYLELQQLLQQIDSPELQATLRQMQEALRNVNQEQMRNALQQMSFSEETFRKSIERTLSLLKRIQIEQKLDEVIKRTNELKNQQETLKNQTAKASRNDQQQLQKLAEQQKDLKKEFKQLEKTLAELQKKMDEFPDDMPLQEYANAVDSLGKMDVASTMQQAKNNLEQGQTQSAQQQQQNAEQSLSQFAQQMMRTQNAMRQKMQNKILAGFKKAMHNLLDLSEREEDLKNETRSLDPSSQRMRENTENQLHILEDLQKLSNDLASMSKQTFAVTPQMGKTLGKANSSINSALEALEERNGQSASRYQTDAMAAFNDAVGQIGDAMNQAQQGGQGGLGSLLNQLAMMAARQQGINGQTQQLGENGSLTAEQAAQAARLAGEQSAIQKSLEQLAQEAQQSRVQDRLLGNLNEISDEMKEVVKDLEQNDVSENTTKHQDRILSRLLDAQRSMRERDYEKRRRAETGKDIQRPSPVELNSSQLNGQSRLMQDLQKAMQQGYTKEYQELIRKYFEMLERKN